MPVLFLYILKLSISLSIIYLFYQLVLRRLTFYNFNRWYLIGYTFLSFLIPFINITPVLEKNSISQNGFVQMIPTVEKYTSPQQQAPGDSILTTFAAWTTWDWISIALLAGAGLFLLRFIIRCVSFFNMRRKAELISVDGMKLYQVNKSIIPFSFGNAVFINSDLHTEEELREIIRHEFVHVKQKHTLDIIWSEWLCIINWYNPFAWMLKKSIRQNLEFIADSKVLQNGVDRKQYQYLLLKVIGSNHFSIAPKFNFSSLKKRIVMMNKLQSARLHLVKFLFIVPMLSIILISFRQRKQELVKAPTINEAHHLVADTVPVPPTPPVPPVPPVQPAAPKQIKLPGNVKSINVNNDKATVYLKNGTKENFDLSDPEQKASFEKKYGPMPEPPAPPVAPTPPVPPVAPVKAIAAPHTNTNNLANLSDNFEITGKKAVLHLKNGVTEEYDLTNTDSRSKFEKKYGKIIHTNVNANVNTSNSINISTTNSVNASSNINAVAVVSPVAVTNHTSASTVITATSPVAVTSQNVIAIDPGGYALIGEEEILVTITRKTTADQLEEFKKQMKEKGIDLKFDEIDYDNGKLVKISGTLKSKDGKSKSNFSVTDFSKVILASITDGSKTYFKVNIVDNKRTVI